LDLNAVEYRIKGLESDNVKERRWSAWNLWRQKEMGPVARAALVKALADEDAEVARSALDALREIGPIVVPDLLPALTHKNTRVRSWVISILEYYPSEAKLMLAPLLAATKDADLIVRSSAGEALSLLCERAPQGLTYVKQVLPVLLRLFGERDAYIRCRMADSLGRLGPAARPGLPLLLGELRSDNLRLRAQTAEAVAKIAPADKEVINAVLAAFQHKESGWVLARAVGEFGPAAKAAIPTLVDLIRTDHPSNRPDSAVRLAASRALAKMGNDAKSAVAPLLVVTLDPKVRRELRREVVAALGALGPVAREAVPALEDLARRETGLFAETVVAALKAINSQ
jgi:HEAT repeat protein